MAKKKKKFVWHKKKEKFIPSSAEKTKSIVTPIEESRPVSANKQEKLKAFAKNLSSQIKKAVRESSK